MARPAPDRSGRAGALVTLLIGACLLLALQLVVLPAFGSRRVRTTAVGISSAGAMASSAAASAPAAPAAPLSNRTGTFETVLSLLPAPPHTVVLTFGTVAVLDFALNWVAHVERLPQMEPFVVAALDEQVLVAMARRGGVRAFLAPRWQIIADRGFTSEKQHKDASEYFRSDLSAFKKMGHVKALTIAALVERQYAVLVSDVDVIWLRHPWGVLHAPGKPSGAAAAAGESGPSESAVRESLAEADLLISTDSVDYALDAAAYRLLEAEINTGVLFVRASAVSLAFLREWSLRCLHTRDGHDQQELNHLLKGCYPHEGAGAGVDGPRDPADRNLARCTPAPYEPTFVLAAGEGEGDGEGAVEPARLWVGGAAFVPWVPHHQQPPADDTASSPGVGLARAAAGVSDRRPALRAAAAAAARAPRARLGRARLGASLELLARGGRRAVQWLWHGRLRAAVLPMGLFLGGHTFFVQHVHERPGAPAPIAVHLSWGFGDLFGKRERLRERGWWLVEERGYFERGRFIRLRGISAVYDEAVAPFRAAAVRCLPAEAALGRPEALCWHPANLVDRELALQARHPRAATDPAAPQLAAQAALRRVLRNGFALAEATGRVLVLPELRCYCERFWWLLEDCRVAGAQSMALPFVCPFDFLFEPFWWDELRVERRHASFWDDPRVPPSLLASTARLEIRGGPRAPAQRAQLGEAAEAAADGAPTLALELPSSIGGAARALGASAAASAASVLEVDAASLASLDGCVPQLSAAARSGLNERLSKLLGGLSVEYCSRERNPFLGARTSCSPALRLSLVAKAAPSCPSDARTPPLPGVHSAPVQRRRRPSTRAVGGTPRRRSTAPTPARIPSSQTRSRGRASSRTTTGGDGTAATCAHAPAEMPPNINSQYCPKSNVVQRLHFSST